MQSGPNWPTGQASGVGVGEGKGVSETDKLAVAEAEKLKAAVGVTVGVKKRVVLRGACTCRVLDGAGRADDGVKEEQTRSEVVVGGASSICEELQEEMWRQTRSLVAVGAVR